MGTKMFRSRWFRLSALFAVLLTVLSLSAVTTAEARFGGSSPASLTSSDFAL